MSSRDMLLGVLHEACRTVSGRRVAPLEEHTDLRALGLGSLQAMEMLVVIEQELGVRLADTAVQQARTAGDLCDVIAAAVAGTAPAGTPLPAARSGQPPQAAADGHQPADAVPRTDAPPGPADRQHGLQAVVDLVQEAQGPSPYFALHDGRPGATTLTDGERRTMFSSFDYLGLGSDPQVIHAAKEAIDRYGTTVAASRAASGERPVHRALESALADFLKAEAALAFVSGHGTNVSVLGHLAGPQDLIVHDALAHNSLVQGAELSGARRRVFPHNDIAFLDRLLTAERHRHRRVVVVAEGVYSMDGDLADLPALVELRERHQVMLYVDEAHSIGVLGASGAGVVDHWQLPPDVIDVRMGTLSKALASSGGFIAGAGSLITHLKQTTPGFVYGCGMAPSVAGAAHAALGQLRVRPQLAATARRQADLFRTLAREAGLNTGRSSAGSCVVPIVVGDDRAALDLATRLGERGISVCPFVSPAVERGQARLRFFVTACHTDAQIHHAVTATAALLAGTSGAAVGGPADHV
ncbi:MULTISPECIES: aminotransferase class I/II-fold pyridoxal phosphate-dependent enzyme [unclassified Streptomyces]|uniref:aminotransferase class I/II-fold pyridoxal phosphate-dependent enzyme n=1 Tax=unclassified Streptomyces TaxID=2593676 RepID=UPI0033A137CA